MKMRRKPKLFHSELVCLYGLLLMAGLIETRQMERGATMDLHSVEFQPQFQHQREYEPYHSQPGSYHRQPESYHRQPELHRQPEQLHRQPDQIHRQPEQLHRPPDQFQHQREIQRPHEQTQRPHEQIQRPHEQEPTPPSRLQSERMLLEYLNPDYVRTPAIYEQPQQPPDAGVYEPRPRRYRVRLGPRRRRKFRTSTTSTTTTTTTTTTTPAPGPEYYDTYYEDDDYYDYQAHNPTTTTTTTTTTTVPPRPRRRGGRRPQGQTRTPASPNFTSAPTTTTSITTTTTTTTTTTPATTTTTLSPNYKPRKDGRIIDYVTDLNFPYELRGADLTDYPFYITLPESIEFKCDGRHDGYYANVEHKCQVYHHCANGHRYDFLCANYTSFDQTTFTCRFVNTVDCRNSANHFHRNEELYVEKDEEEKEEKPIEEKPILRKKKRKETEVNKAPTGRETITTDLVSSQKFN